ncbi:MAG: hypothetical protein IMY72_06505 [Bacteroidetes bacterium]|nr:hypothetical protein [Bacteroidota bacterium]
MKCNKIYQDIVFGISNKEIEKHLKECSHCNEINTLVNNTMSVLDQNFEASEDLINKVLLKKRDKRIQVSRVRKTSLSMYAQFAAVIVISVFLGVILGKNAETKLLTYKMNDKSKSLIEFREAHHLVVAPSVFHLF